MDERKLSDLTQIENCGKCPFSTCADEGYETIQCPLFTATNEPWVLRSARCEECRHADHRDAIRRRILKHQRGTRAMTEQAKQLLAALREMLSLASDLPAWLNTNCCAPDYFMSHWADVNARARAAIAKARQPSTAELMHALPQHVLGANGRDRP